LGTDEARPTAPKEQQQQQQPTGVRDEISWAAYVAPSPLLYQVESHTASELHCRLPHCNTPSPITLVLTPIGPRPLQHRRATAELETLRQCPRSTLDHAFNRHPRVSAPIAYILTSLANSLLDCSKTTHTPLSRSEQTASQHSANSAHPIWSTS
jgi:hypothetical protein